MSYIDRKSHRFVDLIRQNQTKDDDGNYVSDPEQVLYANVCVDIQPISGNVKAAASGPAKNADFLMFTEEYYTDLIEHDIVRDGETDYEITFIADFESHNEIYLRRL